MYFCYQYIFTGLGVELDFVHLLILT